MKKLLLCLSLLWLMVSMAGCKDEVAKVGEPAPPLTVLTLSGDTFSDNVWKPGQYTYLNFWSLSCAPCMVELSHLEELSREFSGRVRIVSVNVRQETPPVFASLPRLAQAYTILYDPLGITAEQYLVMATPSSYIIDDKGVVRQSHVGMRTMEELKMLFEQMAQKELS